MDNLEQPQTAAEPPARGRGDQPQTWPRWAVRLRLMLYHSDQCWLGDQGRQRWYEQINDVKSVAPTDVIDRLIPIMVDFDYFEERSDWWRQALDLLKDFKKGHVPAGEILLLPIQSR